MSVELAIGDGTNGGHSRAALLSHVAPADTGEAIETAVAAARAAGVELVSTLEETGAIDSALEGLRIADELPADVDLSLALGGDGTILRSLRRYTGTGVPTFGINYGTIGFLAASEGDALDRALVAALEGEFEVLSLPGLQVDIGGFRGLAFNDVTFARRPHKRVAELSYRLGGREVGHVRCDGLVAATPVGSTGYNLANGGPILAWGVAGYAVSFIAPHTLTARALVVAPDDVLHVHNLGEIDSADVALDGVPVGNLGPGDEIEVRFVDDVAALAQLPGANFYRRIREKFGQLAG